MFFQACWSKNQGEAADGEDSFEVVIFEVSFRLI